MVLELGIAFVTGGLVGMIAMALLAARANDELHVMNARLASRNRALAVTLHRLHPDADQENVERARQDLIEARKREGLQ